MSPVQHYEKKDFDKYEAEFNVLNESEHGDSDKEQPTPITAPPIKEEIKPEPEKPKEEPKPKKEKSP